MKIILYQVDECNNVDSTLSRSVERFALTLWGVKNGGSQIYKMAK